MTWGNPWRFFLHRQSKQLPLLFLIGLIVTFGPDINPSVSISLGVEVTIIELGFGTMRKDPSKITLQGHLE